MTVKQLTRDPLNLIIAGVGGQGNVIVSLLLGTALVERGYYVSVGETYGASQRGGPVMSHVRISQETQFGPLIPNWSADIVLGMEPVETLRILRQYGNPEVTTILNPRPVYPIGVLGGEADYPNMEELLNAIKELSKQTKVINATEEAQKLGNPIYSNVILIGALIGSNMLPLDKEAMEVVLKDSFPKALETNIIALARGIELGQE